MTVKPRQSVKLTDPQTAFLNAEARALGITVAELIRRIIDAWRFQASNHLQNGQFLNDDISEKRSAVLAKKDPPT